MAVSITDLWLAILLAGFLCWMASALVHMLIKYHNSDYKELENEDEVSAALNAGSPAPALYTMPYCSDMSAMEDDAMQKKFADGPVAMITVLPSGMPAMGKLLGQQILFFIFGSALIAYLAAMSIGVGADSMLVFRQVFVASFMAYGWAQIPFSIWMGQPWSNCLRYLVDALIYAVITGVIFSLFWPSLV